MDPTDRYWQETFDRLARAGGDVHAMTGYERTPAAQEREKLILDRLAALSPERHRWPGGLCRGLDIGCNAGYFTARIAAQGIEVTGLDFSSAALGCARRDFPSIEFIEGDAMKLPFADQSFELVTSFGVIQTVSSWQRALSEMVRVLRPGGLGILETNRRQPWAVNLARQMSYVLRGRAGLRQAWEQLRRTSASGGAARHSTYFGPAALLAELRGLGVRETRAILPSKLKGLLPGYILMLELRR